jgi:hypothetical protein
MEAVLAQAIDGGLDVPEIRAVFPQSEGGMGGRAAGAGPAGRGFGGRAWRLDGADLSPAAEKSHRFVPSE